MGKKYLIDTNVIIQYSGDLLPKDACSFVSGIIDEQFNISVINKIEVLGHNKAGKEIEDFIGLAYIYDLCEKITNKTIELRKIYKPKLPDAIIAATALVNNFTIVTRNTKDFEDIEGLDLINPWNL